MSFEATFEPGKLRYVDTRPYQLNLPFYAFDATPQMIDRVDRRPSGLVFRLNEAVVWAGSSAAKFVSPPSWTLSSSTSSKPSCGGG
jgi:hypothetical protein